MKVEKVVSFYNLQDEQELAEMLDRKQCLDYKKISTEIYDGSELARYHIVMEGAGEAAEFWDIFARLFKRNTNLKMRVCNPE